MDLRSDLGDRETLNRSPVVGSAMNTSVSPVRTEVTRSLWPPRSAAFNRQIQGNRTAAMMRLIDFMMLMTEQPRKPST